MKKVLCTIMGAMLLATTGCGKVSKGLEYEPKAVYNKTYCCPTEPETKQIARKIRESGYSDKLVDVEIKDGYYDIEKECLVREYSLKFENVNGFEKYNSTVYICMQPTEKYFPGNEMNA